MKMLAIREYRLKGQFYYYERTPEEELPAERRAGVGFHHTERRKQKRREINRFYFLTQNYFSDDSDLMRVFLSTDNLYIFI
jgi:hypothetical protein